MNEPIYFGNMIHRARNQYCMSISDFQLIMRNTHGINLSDLQIYELESNLGDYEYLIPVLAQVYNCSEDWLRVLYHQTPRR